MDEEKAVVFICEEYRRAKLKFSDFHSAHEGYAVLLEEVDELWETIRIKTTPNRGEAMACEAVQVAAMALRFLVDCC